MGWWDCSRWVQVRGGVTAEITGDVRPSDSWQLGYSKHRACQVEVCRSKLKCFLCAWRFRRGWEWFDTWTDTYTVSSLDGARIGSTQVDNSQSWFRSCQDLDPVSTTSTIDSPLAEDLLWSASIGPLAWSEFAYIQYVSSVSLTNVPTTVLYLLSSRNCTTNPTSKQKVS